MALAVALVVQIVLFSLADQRHAVRTRADREHLALEAVAAVSATLNELSTDSLHRWQARYAEALSGLTNDA